MIGPERKIPRDTPFTRFVRGIRDGDIEVALNKGIGERRYFRGRERTIHDYALATMGASVDRGKMHREAPEWFDFSGFVSLISELNSTPVWMHLIKQTNTNLLKDLKEPSGRRKSKRHTAHSIGVANSGVFANALTNALLGAVMGNQVEGVLTTTTTRYDIDGTQYSNPTIAYDVAMEVGKRFSDPVKSPNELLERFRSLIPNPNNPAEPANKLIGLFVRLNTFDKPDSGGVRHCPAVHLTSVMVDLWGEKLAKDEAYQKRFLQAVQK